MSGPTAAPERTVSTAANRITARRQRWVSHGGAGDGRPVSEDSVIAGRSPAPPEVHRAATAPAAGLNGSHALHVFSTFQHVDGLLASIEKLARSDLSDRKSVV